MKKILLCVLIIQLAAAFIFSIPGGDRRRFYVITGIGYASSHPEGFLAQAGVEVRLFGNIHTRVMLDYYPGRDIQKDSITLRHMYGITLYAVYKLQLSEYLEFRLKLGGHYTSIRAEITALGLIFTTTMADVGYGGGVGFSWQLDNRLYLYAEAGVKHLLLDEPWTWVKGEMGLMFRLR